MTITPGIYLQRRRSASGQSLETVAQLLDTEPHVDERARAEWLRRIELDEQPISLPTLVALRRRFLFDYLVIFALERIRQGSLEDPPRLCRVCACSEHDACVIDAPQRTCWWARADLCSGCLDADTAAGEVAAAA